MRFVDEPREIVRKRLLPASGWARDQICVREPILFVCALQIFQRSIGRESHIRFLRRPVVGNAMKLSARFLPRSVQPSDCRRSKSRD